MSDPIIIQPTAANTVVKAAAQPVTITVPKASNSHSWLAVIGRGFKGVFAFLGSPVGKAAVGFVERGIELAVPEATGLINIANTYLTEVIKTETLAAAAGAQEGSNVQKAAIAIFGVTPQALAFAVEHGLEPPTAADIQRGVDLMVEFANLFKPKALPAPAGS